ncbi:MAG: hypothetical protein ACR9NN_02590 [Nostochopsis sp.]
MKITRIFPKYLYLNLYFYLEKSDRYLLQPNLASFWLLRSLTNIGVEIKV